MQSQEESMQPSFTDREDEVTALQEELQLVVKKEKEAQVYTVCGTCGDA